LKLINNFLEDAGLTKAKAKEDIQKAVDSIIWYAGMADKWEQMTGNLKSCSGRFLQYFSPGITWSCIYSKFKHTVTQIFTFKYITGLNSRMFCNKL
jgi:hypothetical protein